jgi:hypothetical protein
MAMRHYHRRGQTHNLDKHQSKCPTRQIWTGLRRVADRGAHRQVQTRAKARKMGTELFTIRAR